MSYLNGVNVSLYETCSSPAGIGIDGINAPILNYSYPSPSNGERTFLPAGYVVDYPSSQANGGVSYGVIQWNVDPSSATAGENGFCIITY